MEFNLNFNSYMWLMAIELNSTGPEFKSQLCVYLAYNLSKLHNLSKSQFPKCKMEKTMFPYLTSCDG